MSRHADPTAKISLLRASEEVFAEKGLSLAKVEEITKRAGLSKGAFYLHFESKEEAFKQVVESFLARLAGNLPDSPDVPANEDEALATWLELDEQMYAFLWQNRAIVTILMGCQGEYQYLAETFLQNIHRRTCAWIDAWKARGFFRHAVDTDIAATLVCGAHNELSRRLVVAPKRPPIREWVASTQSVFARGFGTARLVEALERNPEPNVRISERRIPAAGSKTGTRAL